MLFGPFAMQWRTPSPNPPSPTPLPSGISQIFIPTPSGPLEILSALPSSSPKSKPTLFFAHGGFGCAEMWIPWMLYFSAKGYACYAVSYRGHGKSWYPGFLRMVWTGRGTMAGDLVEGVRFVERCERKRRGVDGNGEGGEGKIVLIGHSAGAGLSQYVLSRGLVQVHGFVICAGVPAFGSASCYVFWAPMAPLHFPYRLFHPRYPLATTSQIRAAFFAPDTPLPYITHLERLLSPYESLLWPMQMMWRFVTGPDVMSNITGWRTTTTKKEGNGKEGCVKPRLLVLAGEKDVVCKPWLLLDAAKRYQAAFRDMVGRGQVPGIETKDLDSGDSGVIGGSGVLYRVAKGVGHHMQNQEEGKWQRGAEEIAGWLEGL
ncbi:Alpha/Beta hydrolase protein [Clohesyomyces aquaticus]|uniref:Alpha/Beta hydrolase protein n=1 Tax=Clohesyomyces aquaticus TaxID=1231657 RepID=A0A1Y2A750_9PLEO|nr:Alpha/Beta hydrolase protein [Clohesyomyces aquaticus]